jgi:hypothetical protein
LWETNFCSENQYATEKCRNLFVPAFFSEMGCNKRHVKNKKIKAAMSAGVKIIGNQRNCNCISLPLKVSAHDVHVQRNKWRNAVKSSLESKRCRLQFFTKESQEGEGNEVHVAKKGRGRLR